MPNGETLKMSLYGWSFSAYVYKVVKLYNVYIKQNF